MWPPRTATATAFEYGSGTNEFNLRLYFVDAPEPNLRYPDRTREQSEYFGVTLDDTIKGGVKAGETVRELLQQPFVVRTRWATAGGRSREPRYYGFVEVGGTNLAELLVAQSWARTKGVMTTLPSGEKSKAFADKLRALEAAAREKRLGVWANSPPPKPETGRQQSGRSVDTTGKEETK